MVPRTSSAAVDPGPAFLMQQEAKWAMHNKLVAKKEMPNYLDFFSFDALEKVKPEAVSIVH